MSNVSGVRQANAYGDQDIDGIAGNEQVSTNTAINSIANHAGVGRDVSVRGDDRSEREIHAEHKREQGKDGAEELAAHGVYEYGVTPLVGHVLGAVAEGALLPAGLVVAGAMMMMNVGEDGQVGAERANANVRDQMHVMILGTLNGLPQAYVDKEMGRYTADQKNSSFVGRMNADLGKNVADQQAMAVIQLHGDQGMNAARQMCDARTDKDAYMKAHPDVAKRYAQDAAFRYGFDGVVFAQQQGPDAYKDVIVGLQARDARYTAHHVAVQG